MAFFIARSLAPAAHMRSAISSPAITSPAITSPANQGRINSNGHVAGFRVPKSRCRAADEDTGVVGLGLGLRVAWRSEVLSGASSTPAIAARSGAVSRAGDGALRGSEVLFSFPVASRGWRQAFSGGKGKEEEKEGGRRQYPPAPAAGFVKAEVEGEGGLLAEIANDVRREQHEDPISSTATVASTNDFTFGLASTTALFSQALWSAAPALAAYGRLNLPDEIPPVTAEDWHAIILVYGGFAIFYFLILPPTLLHWMRIRERKKTLLETFILYYFVFVNFLGLMLWAPFTNFRPLPRDPSKMPKFDD